MNALDALIVSLRLNANRLPVWEGRGMLDERYRQVDWTTGVILFFSRDAGMHDSGWFKNPDYERCFHVSISGFDPVTKDRRIVSRSEAALWARRVFGDDTRWSWCEPAASEAGKTIGVVHYRLFCDAGWQPIKPRGEVYSLEFTEKGWQSWSDRHGSTPEPSILHAG